MFGINLKDLRIREYTCSPEVTGRANVAFGAAYGAVVAVLLPVCGLPDVWSTAFLVASPLCLVLWGLYCWKLRRRPVKRQVTLGGPAHRLYVRSRWMFVVYGLTCACVEYAVVMALVSLLESGADMGEVFLERLRGLFVLLLVMFYRVFFEYLSYYQYFHMPESSRRDLFTEAVKQMNEDGKKRE